MYLLARNQVLPQDLPARGIDTLIGEHLSGPLLVLVMLFFYFLALCDKWHQLEAAESRRLQAMENRRTTHVSYGATASSRHNTARPPPATVDVTPHHEIPRSRGDSGTGVYFVRLPFAGQTLERSKTAQPSA
ncbi:hypothetical protein P691DRAFT_802003 [Macrolepiota fuliginosa MF-IS2]|uniref:Uncharacterized protein n=1 Tax=Macrolepiota fuliginosa MF-IS2 TaxID=1400762 RepID=A0A9P5XLQ1_9AGAR|nr:hypothetical protein P691DRAFT_802003 [Macrolepiota fuliginosa MF-IS2]